MDLWDFLPAEPPADSLQARFEEWLSKNPHVYSAFKAAALELKRRGRPRFGAKAIVEELRWNSALYSIDPEGWKLNNTWVSRLARKLLEDVPELEGFLELRRLQRD